MTPGVADYKTFLRGDTVNARRFTVTRDAAPYSLVGVDIRATFRMGGQAVEAGITVVDAAGGIFQIDPFQMQVPGLWKYDVQFTNAAGEVRTYVKGALQIVEDVTR